MTATLPFSTSAMAVFSLMSLSSFSASWEAVASSTFFTASSPCIHLQRHHHRHSALMHTLISFFYCQAPMQRMLTPRLPCLRQSRAPTFMRLTSTLASFIFCSPTLMELASSLVSASFSLYSLR